MNVASYTENYSKKTKKLISFRLRADLGRGPDGKQIVKTKTIPVPPNTNLRDARKMARQEAEDWERELKKGKAPATEKTFRRFIEDDFLVLHNTELKPTSREFYKNISVRPLNYFGNTVLTEINSMDVERFMLKLHTDEQKNGKPLSTKTIRHIYTFLKSSFKFAYQHKLISENPMEIISPPKLEKKKIDFLTEAEAKEFLEALKTAPLRWKVLMETLICLGLRRGEAAGLMWSDLNFDEGTLTVERNVTYVPGSGLQIGTPKTDNSTRVLPVPAALICNLKKWQKEQAAPHGSTLIGAYIFSDIKDPFSPIRPDRITQWLRRFEKEHGLKEVSPHDLRHTAATLLLSGGANVKAVQEILGHADSSTTLNFYTAVIKEDLKRATDNLGAALGL